MIDAEELQKGYITERVQKWYRGGTEEKEYRGGTEGLQTGIEAEEEQRTGGACCF